MTLGRLLHPTIEVKQEGQDGGIPGVQGDQEDQDEGDRIQDFVHHKDGGHDGTKDLDREVNNLDEQELDDGLHQPYSQLRAYMSGVLGDSGVRDVSLVGHIDYLVPRNAAYIRVGTTVKDQYWWAPGIKEVNINMKISKLGDLIVVIYMASKKLIVGDKLGAHQGLKFMIGVIVPYDKMLGILDHRAGEEFKLNLLSSTKSLTRDLEGHLREIAAMTFTYKFTSSFRTAEMIKTKNPK
ncbi:hypothetical protein ACHAQK_009284, partial [Fusarium lateritium]